MHDVASECRSSLLEVANAIVRLHKEYYGRGPTKARAYFAGQDVLVCVLADALVPSERKMTELGLQEHVRHSRALFQSAVRSEFIATIEAILDRKVVSFASAIDPDSDLVFENFYLGPHGLRGSSERARDGLESN